MLRELLHADTLAARVARRLLPTALLVMPALGLLRYLGEQAGLYDTGPGVALMVLLSTLVLGAVSWWTVALIRQADEARRVAEGQLDRFFALSPDLFVVAGFDGRFHRVNDAWGTTLGYTLDELTARPFLDFVHPDDRGSTAVAFERLLEGHDVVSFENRYLARDGSVHWLQWSARSSPEVQRIQAVARDVTDARRTADELARTTAEADRANQAKSEFLSRMSHELRTPMNSVLGFTQLLERDETLTDDQRSSVRYIASGGRHLLQLIDEVLDIARIEAGRLPLSPEPVAVCDLLDDAVALIRPLAAERRITITLDRDDCSRYVRADRQRLKQVVLNLLSNAVKYNREAGAVHVGCDAVTPGRFRIAVTDTGPGIATDHLERLFVPFDRLGAEGSAAEGTGIGLNLSKALVEAMGGAIGVESQPGEGSTFWVEFERIADPMAAITGQVNGRGNEATPAAEGSVLYIEDNLANVRLIERILADRPGVRLLTAMQGRIGLELARRHRPDVILLDLHLPDMDGRAVLHQLRTTPETEGIPVAIISADATEGQVKRLLSAGAAAYLAKPLDVGQLLDVVDAAVGSG